MKRIINIDWLSLYCLCSASFRHQQILTSAGYQIKLRGDGTRHFKKLYDVISPFGEPLLEIQEEPKSLKISGGIWQANAMLIKINNKQLYAENTIQTVYDLLLRCEITIKSISRLDIAMDFNYFDNHMHPQTLIRNFMLDELWYLFSKKFTCIGKQGHSLRYEYLRFGSASSAYQIYLYNKSRELKEQKDKVYIRDIWEVNNLNMTDVWRLEISLRTDAKAILKYEDKIKRINKQYINMITGEAINDEQSVITDKNGELRQVERITIDNLISADFIQHLYMRIVNHLFHFRTKVKGEKKSKAKRLELIKISESDTNYRPVRLTSGTSAGRTDKIVFNYLDKLKEENGDLLASVYEIKREIIKKTGIKA